MSDGKPPGYDRAPTLEEALRNPDERPWTEYDANGNKQERPPYRGWMFRACLCCGPPACVWEMQLCECCGDDMDAILCKCNFGRLKMCLCFGPRCDTRFCSCCVGGCCGVSTNPVTSVKVQAQECCECDCFDRCAPRYSGCILLCCHCSCLQCPVGCQDHCCCNEEQMMMDGDLKPLAPLSESIQRNDGYEQL